MIYATPRFKAVLLILVSGCLNSCVKIPEGVEPVRGFKLEHYLGKWYEIARLDHSFERGLTRVTAEYSMREDGGVKVINRGFNADENEWEEAVGKAYFVEGPDVGRLKVSFFGPFYGAYNILALDKNAYRYSLVAGPDRSYLWILARTPELEQSVLDSLVHQAKELGFPVNDLIYVSHE